MDDRKRHELRLLVNFIETAYRIPDVKEQYRDWKKESPACVDTHNGTSKYEYILSDSI